LSRVINQNVASSFQPIRCKAGTITNLYFTVAVVRMIPLSTVSQCHCKVKNCSEINFVWKGEPDNELFTPRI